MVVYLDGLMGLNFLIDWMLLLGVNRLAGFPPGKGRTAAAAAVGSGYAGLCFLPGCGFLAGDLWRGLSLGLMSLTAFGLGRSAVRRGLLFVLLSMALGGIAICADLGSVPGLIFCGGGLWLLCRWGFRGQVLGRKLVEVQLFHRGNAVRLTALCDTGNGLRDPLTGEPVLVVDAEAGWALLGIGPEEFRDPAALVAAHPELRLRLLPYGTVGNSGLLAAIRCDRVELDGRPSGTLTAFSPQKFGNGEYQALTGGQDG